MSTTFAVLKTEVSEALRDPDFLTFDDPAVGRMVNMAIAEVGRVAPLHFQDDITPVLNTLEYTLREDYFAGEDVPEIEVVRVELWDGSTTPATPLAVLPAASGGRENDSQSGWVNWGGNLIIPRRIWSSVDGHEDDYYYRVWGYCPYAQLSADEDVFDGSDELKWAVVTYSQLVALRRLVAERELFTQWQTRSGNTDITPAGLMGDYARMREEWRVTKRELYRHRSKV